MNHAHRVFLRRLSVSVWIATACVVVARPVQRVWAMNVNELKMKAQEGYVSQQLELGEAYLTGKGVPKSAANAEYWYEKAARSGDAEAENLVAYMYQAGIGVQADPAHAVRWYEMSAAAGCSDAMINLGVLHIIGVGVRKDPVRASEYFQKGLEHGNGTGGAYLGTMAYTGLGMGRDSAAAERWFKAGQKLRDPISTYDLGALYSTMPDHPHDLAKAARYFRQAADAHYVPAMRSLGILLVRHPELTHGSGEAVKRLQAAADDGSWQASVLLGVMAHTGSGMPLDNQLAYLHLRIAELQGGSAARILTEPHIPAVLKDLNEEQASIVEAKAAEWYSQHSGGPALVRTKGQLPKFFADPVTTRATPDLFSAVLPAENPGS